MCPCLTLPWRWHLRCSLLFASLCLHRLAFPASAAGAHPPGSDIRDLVADLSRRYSPHPYVATSRTANATLKSRYRAPHKRQLPTEINIQVTAPLFSSRLYDFGVEHGDAQLETAVDGEMRIQLRHPIAFFGENFDAIYYRVRQSLTPTLIMRSIIPEVLKQETKHDITTNGAVGFEEESRHFKTERFPAGLKLIAPLWNRNDLRRGGKIFYREMTEGRVLERAESEIRYQYDKKAKPAAVVLITWHQMQPMDQTLPLANTNSFQLAIASTDNGTFANCIYKNIGWSQGAQAGFNKGDEKSHYTLPLAANGDVRYLQQVGNTGIPGEWMFEIDMPRITRCKAGVKGDTCENECSSHEWGYDCANCCHCAKGPCNVETGECQSKSECTQCWGAAPFCQTRDPSCRIRGEGCGPNAISFTEYDRCGEPMMRCQCLAGFEGDGHACKDIDECQNANACSAAKSKCVNTPGRYYCDCLQGFEGDNCTEQLLIPFDASSQLTQLSRLLSTNVTISLRQPQRLFGQDADTLMVSSFGLITLHDPGQIDPQRDLDAQSFLGFAPFYGSIDLSKGGSVHMNETSDASILQRLTSLVRRHTSTPAVPFTASDVIVVTFSNVSSLNSVEQHGRNTLQALIIGGQNSLSEPQTYALYLYKDLFWTDGAQAMILAEDPGSSVVLPGSGTENLRQLAAQSNIQEPGKWLFRVDQRTVLPCPQGASLEPPRCVALDDTQTQSIPWPSDIPFASKSHAPASVVDQNTESTVGHQEAAAATFAAVSLLGQTTRALLFPSTTTNSVQQPSNTNAKTDDSEDLFGSETVTFPPFITLIPNIVTPGDHTPTTLHSFGRSQKLPKTFTDQAPNQRRHENDSKQDPGLKSDKESHWRQNNVSLIRIDDSDSSGTLFSVGTPPAPSVVLVTPQARFSTTISGRSIVANASVDEHSMETIASPSIAISHSAPPPNDFGSTNSVTLSSFAKTQGHAPPTFAPEGEGHIQPINLHSAGNRSVSPSDVARGEADFAELNSANGRDFANATAGISSNLNVVGGITTTIDVVSLSPVLLSSNGATLSGVSLPPLQIFTTTSSRPLAPLLRQTRPLSIFGSQNQSQLSTQRTDGSPRLVTAARTTARPAYSFNSNTDEQVEAADLTSSSKLAIIIPTAIVGIWLLLLLVIGVVVCCKRRRTNQHLRSKCDPYSQYRHHHRHHHNLESSAAGIARLSKDQQCTANSLNLGMGNSLAYQAAHVSYEDHLEKAARLSEMPQYSGQNINRVSMYNSYWNLPTNGRSQQCPTSSSYYNQGYYESCPEFSRFGFGNRY